MKSRLIIILVLLVGLLGFGYYTYQNIIVAELEDLRASALTLGVDAYNLRTKKEIVAAIEARKAELDANDADPTRKQRLLELADKYKLSYQGLTLSELEKKIAEFEKKLVYLRGPLVSVETNALKTSGRWVTAAQKTPDTRFDGGEIVVSARTVITDAQSAAPVPFEFVYEGWVIEVVSVYEEPIIAEGEPVRMEAKEIHILSRPSV